MGLDINIPDWGQPKRDETGREEAEKNEGAKTPESQVPIPSPIVGDIRKKTIAELKQTIAKLRGTVAEMEKIMEDQFPCDINSNRDRTEEKRKWERPTAYGIEI